MAGKLTKRVIRTLAETALPIDTVSLALVTGDRMRRAHMVQRMVLAVLVKLERVGVVTRLPALPGGPGSGSGRRPHRWVLARLIQRKQVGD